MSAICSSYSISKAEAKDYIDRTTFHLLAKQDKRDLLSKGQVLIAQLEQEYIKNQKRKKFQDKYSYIQLLFDHLIHQSHAQSSTTYVDLEANSKLCIYAGWLTYSYKKTKTKDGKVVSYDVCPHPLNAKADNSGFAKGSTGYNYVEKTHNDYKKLISKCNPTGSVDAMVCNPGLFGMKLGDESDQPFCSSGNNDPYNSSWGCIQAVESYLKTFPEPEREDKRNQILDGIIANDLNGLTSEGKVASSSVAGMLQANYDMCMCAGDSGLINTQFAGVMFKRRTCYAWLMQTKNILQRLSPVGSCHALPDTSLSKNGYQKNDTAQIASLADWADKAYMNIEKELKSFQDDKMLGADPSGYFELTNHDDKDWAKRTKHKDCPIIFDGNVELHSQAAPEGYELLTATIVGDNLPGHSVKDVKYNWSVELSHKDDKSEDIAEDFEIDFKEVPGRKDQRLYKKYKGLNFVVKVTTDAFGGANIQINSLKEISKCSIGQNITEKESKDEAKDASESEEERSFIVALTVEDPLIDDDDDVQIKWKGPDELVPGPPEASSTATLEMNQKATPEEIYVSISKEDELLSECKLTVTPPKDIANTDDKDDSDNKSEFSIKIKNNDENDDNYFVSAIVTKGDQEISESELSKFGLQVKWSTTYTKVTSNVEEKSEKDAGMDDSTSDEKKTTTEDLKADNKLHNVEVDKKEYEQKITASLENTEGEVASDEIDLGAKDTKEESSSADGQAIKKTPGLGTGQDKPFVPGAIKPGSGFYFRRGVK